MPQRYWSPVILASVAGLLIPAIGFAAPLQGPAIPPERIAQVDSFVTRYHARLGLPGVAVSIATGDSVLLAKGYGGDTRLGTPVTGHTPFHIGSVTKTLTALAIVELAGDGTLDLDAPIEAYLPDFSMRRPFVPRSVTLRHLLRHRSGFSQWSGHDRVAQRAGRFDHLAPARAPDLRGEYSSLNFIVLGRVLEQASTRPYAEALREAVLDPLRMHDTYTRATAATGETAAGHQSFFGIQVERDEPRPHRYLVPAGFAVASAHDLGNFTGALVGGGVFGGARVLDSADVITMLGSSDSGGVSLAWGRRRVRGTLVLEHAGNARTSSARVRLVPERGYAITVLSNTNSGPFFPATADLMDGVHRILDGEPAPAAWPRERLFRTALLVGTALSLVQFGRRARLWNSAGHPMRLTGTARVLVPLTVEIAGGALLLVGIPRYFGVPLGTMHEYFPDLSIALVTSAVAGMTGGLLQALTRSRTSP